MRERGRAGTEKHIYEILITGVLKMYNWESEAEGEKWKSTE